MFFSLKIEASHLGFELFLISLPLLHRQHESCSEFRAAFSSPRGGRPPYAFSLCNDYYLAFYFLCVLFTVWLWIEVEKVAWWSKHWKWMLHALLEALLLFLLISKFSCSWKMDPTMPVLAFKCLQFLLFWHLMLIHVLLPWESGFNYTCVVSAFKCFQFLLFWHLVLIFMFFCCRKMDSTMAVLYWHLSAFSFRCFDI